MPTIACGKSWNSAIAIAKEISLAREKTACTVAQKNFTLQAVDVSWAIWNAPMSGAEQTKLILSGPGSNHMKTYTCQYSECQWWIDSEDEKGPYQQNLLAQTQIDEMAKLAGEGQRWSLHYQKRRHRKVRISSAVCHSFVAHLDAVAILLNEPDCGIVYLLGGPDLKIEFYK